MGRFLVRLIVDIIISALAIGLTTFVLPGIHIQPFTWGTLLLLGIVVGVIDGLVRPIISLLSLPITILTLGLFQLVINALMLYLASFIIPAFKIDNFFWALIAGIVLAIIHAILEAIFGGIGKESKAAS
ncbi:MAG TPA: phage holin family protein [Ktedonobacterales bacterium]|nr:phage holin family protein [Ktedonobacterales bacterium]